MKIYMPGQTREQILEAVGPVQGLSNRDFTWTNDQSLPHPHLSKYEKLEMEKNELIEILTKYGVKVQRPAALTDKAVADNFGQEWLKNGYAQVFARDPIFIVGDNVIELSPSQPNRRGDLLGMQSMLHERVPGSGAEWYQMPTTNYTPMLETNYSKFNSVHLEGGDLLLFNETTVLAGMSRNTAAGSSPKGIAWLTDMLGPQNFNVKMVPLKDSVLHLDCAMGVIRPGLATLCRTCLEGEPPSELDGWDIIDISPDDARHLGTNGLPIDEDHYILGTNANMNGTYIKEQLEQRGITVETLRFDAHNMEDGSIRCATHPLRRHK